MKDKKVWIAFVKQGTKPLYLEQRYPLPAWYHLWAVRNYPTIARLPAGVTIEEKNCYDWNEATKRFFRRGNA